MTKKILIFDTTLRDGEQSPGFSMTIEDKLTFASQLERLKVDIIEAGFPASSKGDFEAVKEISKKVKGARIAGLCRMRKEDIDCAWEALKYAKMPRIHTFLATSDIHLKYKLKKTRDEVLKIAAEGVAYAKKYTDDVEFSAEDASRSDPFYLYKIVEAVIDAGATTVNIPDTVGYAVPEEFGALIKNIKSNVPNIDKAVISVHCHNDLGLGVANSISALLNGAGQVECTINGIGERAGNASLEELVMSLRTRKNFIKCDTNIVTEEIIKTSRLLTRITGVSVQPNKAVVGANAFAHEAGIHQDGMLKNSMTYEIMTPESIGLAQSNLVIGKHSGRHAFSKRLESLGYNLKKGELEYAFEKFKELADKKKEIFDEDLKAIIDNETHTLHESYKLEHIQIISGTNILPTATIKLKKDDNTCAQDTAIGDGPVDAAYKAIDRITGTTGKLLSYSLNAITGGKDAIGEVSVKIDFDNNVVIGKGVSTDIIEASVKAYLNAVNKDIYIRSQDSDK